MFFISKDTVYFMSVIAILFVKFTIFFFFPFSELKKVAAGRVVQDADLALKFGRFEEFCATLVSMHNNNKDNQANNTSSDASASNTNTNNVSSNNEASSASSSSSSSGYISVASSPSSSSSDSIYATVKHVREQSNAAALDLLQKIDGLNQENEALNAHIVVLQNQLAKEKTEADTFSQTIANRIELLEHYIKNDSKLEDKRKREVNEVHVMSQKNTELVSQRINTMHDQLAKTFQEFEDRRAKELQSFASNFKSLKKRCDELKAEMDQQAQLIEKQAKETATNTATIQETLTSNALANLGKTVRDAMDLCDSKLNKLMAECGVLQSAIEDTDQDIKTFHERVAGLETEFDDMREEVRKALPEMKSALGLMELDVNNLKQELLHVHFDPDQQTPGIANDDDNTF